jgi:hypothetical protein
MALSTTQRVVVGLLLASAAVTLSACSNEDKPPSPPATTASPSSAPPTERLVGPLTQADADALATMNAKVRDYLALHTQLEASLPKLEKDATPQQIDQNQRLFEQKMREARATAKQGDIFTPEAQPVIKRLLAAIFSGPDGPQLKKSVNDENTATPASLKLTVNSRYPDSVPLATIPPQVLQTLPKLSEDLEYRFIGDWLILFDTHAHVIADFIDNALPK